MVYNGANNKWFAIDGVCFRAYLSDLTTMFGADDRSDENTEVAPYPPRLPAATEHQGHPRSLEILNSLLY